VSPRGEGRPRKRIWKPKAPPQAIVPVEGARHELTVGEEQAGQRLDLVVAALGDLSRTQAATLVATGQVTVNDGREKASYRAEPGDRIVVIVPPPPGREVLGEDIHVPVIFEDEDLLVVDKPAGMVVHPAPGNWTGTLVNALKGRGQGLADVDGEEARQGLVHRLDKETSGLLIVAKTDRAHRVLSAAIAARRVVRRYACLSWGHVDDDRFTVEKPLARDPRDRTRMAVVSSGNAGRAARTDFHRLARFDACDLLRAHLHTGRTHQIRVHLNSIGHPVLGDDTYGGGGGRRLVGLPPRRHWLHAAWLRLAHPVTGAALEFRAPLPDDLRRSLAVAASMPELQDHPDALDYFGFYRFDDDRATP
jgi:23S rRNA pseudouridine1911/1915/1917 synthase